MSHYSKKAVRGSILVTVLFLVSVLALLVATVANDSMQTLKTVAQSGRDTQAKYAAYAGMELVMNELRKEDQYLGDDPAIDENHGRKQGVLGELTKVSYDVLIWNNITEASTGSATPQGKAIGGPGAVLVQPDSVYMVSTGADNAKGEEVVLTTMAGTARRVRPVFEDAAYARTKMILLGDTLVDAWDSEGGFKEYVGGDFPGSGDDDDGDAVGGAGGPDAPPPSTVSDYQATLGTDSKDDRTLRLLESSKLNGFFRIGPSVSSEGAFSDDSGSVTSSGGGFFGGGETTTTYGVSTAADPVTQIAGIEGQVPGKGYYKVDDKSTEMPHFTAPYDADDLMAPPVLANPSTTKKEKDNQGNDVTVTVPPAPVKLPRGGYTRVDVPNGQTLELSPGVYYFKEEMAISGSVKLSGNGPVIVFVGEKAVFNSAEINKGGKTSSLQLCFTDELKDETQIDTLVASLEGYFERPTSSSSSETTTGGTLQEYIKSILTPEVAAPTEATDPDARPTPMRAKARRFWRSTVASFTGA